MLSTILDDPRTRIRCPGDPDPDGKAVVYWMQRAQRADDNPALDAAIAAGAALRKPVVTLFVLDPGFASADLRHFHFMVQGLLELPAALRDRGVGFVLRVAESGGEVARFCHEVRASLVVGDENPLREPERWRQRVAAALRVPFWTVDADVVVPSALLDKEQYSAATIRPRIHRQLEWCLRPGPERAAAVKWRHPGGLADVPPTLHTLDALPIDRRVPPSGLEGGRLAALSRLRAFVRRQLDGYAASRNHPESDGTSRLSPYLHFGQIGPREAALAIRGAGAPLVDRQAFLEQLIVRRELAVNFVRCNPRYDRVSGTAQWALDTLARHRRDRRQPIYPEGRLEAAETNDPLWNAAQRQMVQSGWMHGHLRMYWAKKILEWTRSPEEAMGIAIALNDRYQLDGRDPNGYAGIAWAIAGKHDRAWGPERPVYGTIRYMSLASTSRKFDSRAYIARWGEPASRPASGARRSRRAGHA
jgi:deoxyribodipyrimidine photo-lyase